MDKWLDFLTLFGAGAIVAVSGWVLNLSNRLAVVTDRAEFMRSQVLEMQGEGADRGAQIAVLAATMKSLETLAPGLQSVVMLSTKLDVMLENAARRLELIEGIVFNAVSLNPNSKN